jgi:hypothetical protein
MEIQYLPEQIETTAIVNYNCMSILFKSINKKQGTTI